MQAAFNEAMHHPDWKSRREMPQSTLCDLDMSNSIHHYGHQQHSRESSLNGSDTDLLELVFSSTCWVVLSLLPCSSVCVFACFFGGMSASSFVVTLVNFGFPSPTDRTSVAG